MNAEIDAEDPDKPFPLRDVELEAEDAGEIGRDADKEEAAVDDDEGEGDVGRDDDEMDNSLSICSYMK